MIIVLKDADFSEENIGTIELPRELHQFTKKIFTAFTRFAEDSDQATAVDNFINVLDEQGILSHISFMTMPWLANDSTEMWYDLISEQSMSGGNTQYFSISNGAVTASANFKSVNLPSSIDTLNFFGLIRDIGSGMQIIYNCFTNTNALIGGGINQSTATYPALGPEVNFSTGHGYTNNSGVFNSALIEIGALTALDEDANTKVNGVGVGLSGTFDNTTAMDSTLNQYTHIRTKDVAVRSISFAGDGTALTSTQRTALISALATLQSRLVELEG